MTNADHRRNGYLNKLSDSQFENVYRRRRLALADAQQNNDTTMIEIANNRLSSIFWVAKRRV